MIKANKYRQMQKHANKSRPINCHIDSLKPMIQATQKTGDREATTVKIQFPQINTKCISKSCGGHSDSRAWDGVLIVDQGL